MAMTSLNPLSIVHMITNITINVQQWRGVQEVLREFNQNYHLLIAPLFRVTSHSMTLLFMTLLEFRSKKCNPIFSKSYLSLIRKVYARALTTLPDWTFRKILTKTHI